MAITGTTVYGLEGNARNLLKGRLGKIAKEKIWKLLQKHNMSRREKRKQGMFFYISC